MPFHFTVWLYIYLSWFLSLHFSLSSRTHIIYQVLTMCVCNQWMASCPSFTMRMQPSPASSRTFSSLALCDTSPEQTHSSPPTQHTCYRHSGEYPTGRRQAAVTVYLFPYMVYRYQSLSVANSSGRDEREAHPSGGKKVTVSLLGWLSQLGNL